MELDGCRKDKGLGFFCVKTMDFSNNELLCESLPLVCVTLGMLRNSLFPVKTLSPGAWVSFQPDTIRGGCAWGSRK